MDDFVDSLSVQDVTLVLWVNDMAPYFKRFFRAPLMRELAVEEHFITALHSE